MLLAMRYDILPCLRYALRLRVIICQRCYAIADLCRDADVTLRMLYDALMFSPACLLCHTLRYAATLFFTSYASPSAHLASRPFSLDAHFRC